MILRVKYFVVVKIVEITTWTRQRPIRHFVPLAVVVIRQVLYFSGLVLMGKMVIFLTNSWIRQQSDFLGHFFFRWSKIDIVDS